MDHYGIGIAMSAMSKMYFISGRRTGRTASLVDSLKDGDRVVFSTSREAARVKRLCADKGFSIETAVCDPKQHVNTSNFPRLTGTRRTIFDHSWVETFYGQAVINAAKDIDYLQEQLSGKDGPERGTDRSVRDVQKYHDYI